MKATMIYLIFAEMHGTKLPRKSSVLSAKVDGYRTRINHKAYDTVSPGIGPGCFFCFQPLNNEHSQAVRNAP